MTEAADFTCPRCTSRYKFVRVRADPDLPGRLIHCRVCKEPFAPTDGEYVVKYFLVDKAKKHSINSRSGFCRGSHATAHYHLGYRSRLGFRERGDLLRYHPLRFTLRQGAAGGQPHQAHGDDDVGIPSDLCGPNISMPQIEHDPSPTPQRATLKFDPVFKWPCQPGAFFPAAETLACPSPCNFSEPFNKFWSSKATSVYRCWRNSCNTASHKRSGLSSPVFASSIILLAILSLIRLPWSPTCVSHCECDAHDPPGLGIEFGAVEKLRDGHDTRRCRQWYYANPACDFSRPTLGA